MPSSWASLLGMLQLLLHSKHLWHMTSSSIFVCHFVKSGPKPQTFTVLLFLFSHPPHPLCSASAWRGQVRPHQNGFWSPWLSQAICSFGLGLFYSSFWTSEACISLAWWLDTCFSQGNMSLFGSWDLGEVSIRQGLPRAPLPTSASRFLLSLAFTFPFSGILILALRLQSKVHLRV